MNLFDILKQFKNIEPDPNFTEKSKRMILATPQTSPALTTRGIRMIFRVIETSAAVVLVGFFILLITGGFQNSRLSPVQYSVIDPQGLHAEAQAVEMQIELANINYPESSAAPESTSPTAATGGNSATSSELSAAIATSTASSSPVVNASGTASSTATTSTISIDQALQELSK
jgi:hypothetical protein